MATGVGRGKMRLAAFDGPSPKLSYRCKNLLRKPSYSPFCPKFRCHGNGGQSGKNAIGSIRWPIPENPPIGTKIFFASRVIAHFVPNFVATATKEKERERRRKKKKKGKGRTRERRKKKEGKGEGEEKGEGKRKVKGEVKEKWGSGK